MEKFIHEQNLAVFKKRLAEPHTNAEQEILVKLLRDEQAKEPPAKNGILKPRWSAQASPPRIEYAKGIKVWCSSGGHAEANAL
jgi:hypothetical protein